MKSNEINLCTLSCALMMYSLLEKVSFFHYHFNTQIRILIPSPNILIKIDKLNSDFIIHDKPSNLKRRVEDQKWKAGDFSLSPNQGI